MQQEALEAHALGWWLAVVAMWDGTSIAPGVPHRTTDTVPLPADPAIMIRRHTTMQMTGLHPCVRDHKLLTCVALESESVVESEDYLRALAAYRNAHLSRTDGKPELPAAATMRVKMRLVTEPDSLVPHDWAVTQTVTLTKDSGSSRLFTHVTTWTATYSYP